MSRFALGALVLALSSPAAVAQGESKPLHYLGALGTYTLADDERLASVDYATGLQLLYGYQWADSRWGLEGNLFFDNFETEEVVRTDFYRTGLGVDLVYALGDRVSFTPFLLGGVGYAHNDVLPDTDDGENFVANVGAGFVTAPLTEGGFIRVRGEGRYVYDDVGDGIYDVRVGLGLEFSLGGREAAPEVMVEERVEVVQVPTGVLDSDGDGVIDDRDQCPGTAAGTRVDGMGCPLQPVLELRGVTFEFDRTRLRPDAETILAWAVELLERYPEMRVEVAGHTDNVGTAEYNQQLSLERAAAVREHFIAKGIAADRMEVRGYGFDEPIVDNDTELNRERNRRVELRVLN